MFAVHSKILSIKTEENDFLHEILLSLDNLYTLYPSPPQIIIGKRYIIAYPPKYIFINDQKETFSPESFNISLHLQLPIKITTKDKKRIKIA